MATSELSFSPRNELFKQSRKLVLRNREAVQAQTLITTTAIAGIWQFLFRSLIMWFCAETLRLIVLSDVHRQAIDVMMREALLGSGSGRRDRPACQDSQRHACHQPVHPHFVSHAPVLVFSFASFNRSVHAVHSLYVTELPLLANIHVQLALQNLMVACDVHYRRWGC